MYGDPTIAIFPGEGSNQRGQTTSVAVSRRVKLSSWRNVVSNITLRHEYEQIPMNAFSTCQRCGAHLVESVSEGLCTQCILEDALAWKDTDGGSAEGPRQEDAGTLISRYELMEKLGEGGFGEVWVAEQREPVRRSVALKIIKLGMDTKQIVARFEAERQALAMMEHPNIAKVLDAGATNTGRPYFVMELVRGIQITEYCDRNRLSTRERLELFHQICLAVQHAHQKGVIHRDIKPSNILVTLHDGVPVPKVIDFGIAKATQQDLTEKTLLTQIQQMIGTPAYMSPEQAEMSGLGIDTRTDIYSLGALLYELLTGQPPFDPKELTRGGVEEARKTIQEQEPQLPSTCVATLQGDSLSTTAARRSTEAPKLISLLRGDLDWIVMKCLEKDRTRRYETANGLAMDIKRHLSNETVVARPPNASYRFQKLVRRNKLAFAAIGAVSLTLILGMVASGWQALRAWRAEGEAAAEAARANREATRARETAREMRRQSYAADMKAAHIAIRENNLRYALSLLRKYFPKQNEEDLRGVEWRYLWQACRSDALKSLDHDGAIVRQAVFSPDGRYIATSSFDGMLRIWEVASGEIVEQFDGYRRDGPNHPVAFSPDGRFLAYGHAGNVVLRDITSGWKEVHELQGGSFAVLFSPDGTLLAVEAEDGVHLWDTSTWTKTFLETGFTGSSYQSHLAISGNSQLLAICRRSTRNIQVWDVMSRQMVARLPFPQQDHALTALAFVPGGRWLAAGTSKGHLTFHDLESNKLIKTRQLHRGFLLGLDFSPEGNMLATGGADQIIHLWEWRSAPTGPPTLEKSHTLKGHWNEVWYLDYSPDGRILVSTSKDGTAKIWNATAAPKRPIAWDAGTDPWLLGFSNDETTVHTLGTGQREIHSWDLMSLKLVNTFTLPQETALPNPLTRSGILVEGDTVAFGMTNGTVQIWDLRSKEAERSIRTGNSEVIVLGLSADRRLVFVWNVEARLGELWNLETGAREAAFSEFSVTYLKDVSDSYLGHVAFSPDGRYLAYPTEDYQAKLWDTHERRHWHTLEAHRWRLFRPKFSPNGKLLATASWDSNARLWNVASGKQTVPTLSGHLTGPHALVFSPDGRTLLTSGTGDGMVQFWNVATGKQMVILQDAEKGRLSPDGNTLIWRQSGTFQILHLPSFAEIDAQEKILAHSQSN